MKLKYVCDGCGQEFWNKNEAVKHCVPCEYKRRAINRAIKKIPERFILYPSRKGVKIPKTARYVYYTSMQSNDTLSEAYGFTYWFAPNCVYAVMDGYWRSYRGEGKVSLKTVTKKDLEKYDLVDNVKSDIEDQVVLKVLDKLKKEKGVIA